MGAIDLWCSKVAGYSEIDPYAVSGLLYLTSYFFVIDNSKNVIYDKGLYMHHAGLLQLATLGTTELQLVYTRDCNSSFYFGFVTCKIDIVCSVGCCVSCPLTTCGHSHLAS